MFVWAFLTAVVFVLPVTMAYDGHYDTIPYDTGEAAISYDAIPSLAASDERAEVSGDRVPFAGFTEFLAANRALRLPATDTTLAGTRTLGYTTPSGNVFLQPGLSRAEQLSTLRHESVHAFFSPRGSGPVATFRQNLGQWGYDNSQLLRFTEEAIAETYGSGSLLQGLRHPFVNGYGITPGGLLLEGGVVGGGIFGAGYLGSQGGN
ncbi:hypothetical protein NXS98_07590 [Fontisphaera persica]|uniref:hypothetical protein n=1 Tax=Fontisphaera persica TaxID=2974023 RepID=UPI0024BF76F7|nr:hypothetical protein [Fontisphaera persica]WCJ60972.1 hypothetical protein NXS98_07590 [Fontisphaera persica]